MTFLFGKVQTVDLLHSKMLINVIEMNIEKLLRRKASSNPIFHLQNILYPRDSYKISLSQIKILKGD